MINHRDIVETGKVLYIRTGSHLYGTSTPDSDEDFEGVFVPPVEYILGLQRIEQADLSTKDKNEAGRNTADAVDVTFYELRKFIRLCLECNPNKLELLFANEENVLFKNEIGEELLAHAHLFPYKGAVKRFLGYANSQKHKMRIRTENYGHLTDAAGALSAIADANPKLTMKDLRYQKKGAGMFFNDSYASVGDLNIQYHVKVGKALRMIKDRISKATHRKTLMTKYGYDTKFASHLVRLLIEGIELMQYGRLSFPLAYVKTITDIKRGKWSMIDVIRYSEDLERTLESIVEWSNLPARPRFDEIQALTIRLMEKSQFPELSGA